MTNDIVSNGCSLDALLLSKIWAQNQVLWKLWEWANKRLILSYSLDRKCSCSVLASFFVPRWQATVCEMKNDGVDMGINRLMNDSILCLERVLYLKWNLCSHSEEETWKKKFWIIPTFLDCVHLPLLGWSCEQNPLGRETSLRMGKLSESTQMCQKTWNVLKNMQCPDKLFLWSACTLKYFSP